MTIKISPLIFICILTTLLFACTAQSDLGLTQARVNRISAGTEDLVNTVEKLDLEIDVIVAEIETPDVNWKWVLVQGGEWEPDPLDVVILQRTIQDYVEKEARIQGVQAKEWDGFAIQYQGLMYEGVRRIYVQGLCGSIRDPYLDVDFMLVSDGGPCIFNLAYDAETSEFIRVDFNGEA